jgi:hypothetical protein
MYLRQASRNCATLMLAPAAALLLMGCGNNESGEATATRAPAASTPVASSPTADNRPFRVGRCLDIQAGAKGWGNCGRSHEYEVMLAQRLPGKVTGESARSAMRRACHAALPAFLKSPDANATRLQAAVMGPSQGKDGARWFACAVSEEGPDGNPVRRTGSLAGVLAGGLGSFQKCIVGEPLADEPVRIVPCDRPHRSEAVPGVLVLGAPTDPPPTIRQMTPRALDHCEKAVNTYLGGAKPGVRPSALMPLPEEWRDGETTVICYAVARKPVTGSLRGR